jgi:hypothetical protein
MAIITAIRLKNGSVFVSDERGEQVPEYQGRYEIVQGRIKKDAPSQAVFMHWFEQLPRIVSREEW